jgi:hypothetical protein
VLVEVCDGVPVIVLDDVVEGVPLKVPVRLAVEV